MLKHLILFICLCSPAFGQDPVPTPVPVKVPVFPVIPVADRIPVTPAPVDPDALPVLLPGRLFIVQSDVKFKLFASDDSLVMIRKVHGPRDITAVFADSTTGDDEDREFSSKFLAIVKAAKGASGTLKLIYDPTGAEEESDATTIMLQIGAGPRPPPKPDDPPLPVEDPITRRVKAALLGPDAKADASKFSAVCSELAKALDANQIARLADLETKMKAGLDAVGWVPGKYPDMSKLAGELFGGTPGGEGVADRALTADDKATFSKNLKAIAAACAAVK